MQRILGDRLIAPIGFGAMQLSFASRPSAAEAMAVLREACELRMGVLDTAEAYCSVASEAGHNERLIAAALAPIDRHERPIIATKGGQFRKDDGSFGINGAPGYMKRACLRSLRNLGMDAIDLYYLHWPDPHVPFLDSVGALGELVRQGYVRNIGLCNVTIEQVMDATSIVNVTSVQGPLSLDRVDTLPTVRRCAELGITYLAYWPFGGRKLAPQLAERHPILRTVADRCAVSAYQVALAWLLSLADNIVPIPGARSLATLRDSAAAGRLELPSEDLAVITKSVGLR